jgi:hypothetical protein
LTGEFVSLIPEELIDPKKEREFLLWLLRLPLDVQTKKYILIDWTKLVGVALTEDMVRFISGGRPEITRG